LESNIKEKVIETEETIQKDNKEINLPEKVENRKIKKEEVK
jgi:hypothetical protein